MDTKSILNTWKQSEGNGSINNIVGTPIVEENLLRQIGGGQLAEKVSSGWICTISGECNGGTSCWPSWLTN